MKHINPFALQHKAAGAARRFAKQFQHRALVLARLGTMPEQKVEYYEHAVKMKQQARRLDPPFRCRLRPPGRVVTIIQ